MRSVSVLDKLEDLEDTKMGKWAPSQSQDQLVSAIEFWDLQTLYSHYPPTAIGNILVNFSVYFCENVTCMNFCC